MIVKVVETNLLQAAGIHSISWKESNRSFCTSDFIEMHSIEHQQEYIRDKMNFGSKNFMLIEDNPIGIVSMSIISNICTKKELCKKI